jgi:hypothetical protein
MRPPEEYTSLLKLARSLEGQKVALILHDDLKNPVVAKLERSQVHLRNGCYIGEVVLSRQRLSGQTYESLHSFRDIKDIKTSDAHSTEKVTAFKGILGLLGHST